MNAPKVVIGDGHLGIWGALRGVYPESAWQRCRRSGSSEGSACSNERGWNHKIRNVLDKLPKRSWDEAKKMLSAMSRADTEAVALELRAEFQGWCRERGHGDAADLIEKDWETLVAFYRFPKDHWRHLRTSNPIESPFDRVRLRTNAARRFKKVANAPAVVWKTLMVAERRFRKLTAPEQWAEVFRGVTFKDVDPERHHIEPGERPRRPLVVLQLPALLESGDRGRRDRRVVSQKPPERQVHVAGGQAVEV